MSKAKNQDLTKKLSVIYFFDSKKTRSFSLSLSSVQIVILIVFGLFFWSGLSVYLVDNYSKEQTMLKERLQASLDTIFEYQSRYDGVYELAYPRILRGPILSDVSRNEDLSKVADNSDETSTTVVDSEFSKQKDLSSTSDPSSNDKLNNYEKSHNLVLSIDKIEKQSDKDWPVIVEDISYQKEHGDFELNFSIRNIKSPKRAEGYIWSVLTFVDNEGHKSYISSPGGVMVDKNGKIVNPPKGANWYSIRYYKAKSFYFQIPEDMNGKLSEINIRMLDLEGKKSVYTLPMSSKVIKKAEINYNYRNIIKVAR